MMKHPALRRRTGASLTDLLVVVALIPLCGALFLGCYQRRHEGSQRVKCAANLKAIGNALLMYSNDNKGAYPRTRYVSGATVIPTFGTGAATTQPFTETGPQPNDVTAAIYLLLTTQDITGDSFICPWSPEEKWDFGGGVNGAGNWSNWNGAAIVRRSLSYSYQNPYGDDAAVKSGYKLSSNVSAEFAVFADMNPGSPEVLTVSPGDNAAKMSKANSINHNGDGQNVLFGDGHVDWQMNVFAGVSGDNIYARKKSAGSSRSDSIWNSPLDANDNVLLPTSK